MLRKKQTRAVVIQQNKVRVAFKLFVEITRVRDHKMEKLVFSHSLLDYSSISEECGAHTDPSRPSLGICGNYARLAARDIEMRQCWGDGRLDNVFLVLSTIS